MNNNGAKDLGKKPLWTVEQSIIYLDKEPVSKNELTERRDWSFWETPLPDLDITQVLGWLHDYIWK